MILKTDKRGHPVPPPEYRARPEEDAAAADLRLTLAEYRAQWGDEFMISLLKIELVAMGEGKEHVNTLARRARGGKS